MPSEVRPSSAPTSTMAIDTTSPARLPAPAKLTVCELISTQAKPSLEMEPVMVPPSFRQRTQ